MTQTAYPHFQLSNDRPTGEIPLPAAFHERFPSHFVGQRSGKDLWPPHSPDSEAVRRYLDGQRCLYEEKDATAAIIAYEAALDVDPGYLQAWVALSIAFITENSEESLVEARRILDALAELPHGESGVPQGAASIVLQNRAYLALHHWRRGDGDAWLVDADNHYKRADALGSEPRAEMLFPWAFVRLATGDAHGAATLFEAARNSMPAVTSEYIAKYPDLARFDADPKEEAQ